MTERIDKFDGCESEWWLGIGINEEGRRYCKNCGWTSYFEMFNPFADKYEQWLPRYCPRCGYRNYKR